MKLSIPGVKLDFSLAGGGSPDTLTHVQAL